MTLGTVCSGIGAPEVAFSRHGFASVWCSEVEAFPSAVLAHHWPHVPNLGDFTAAHEYMIFHAPVEAENRLKRDCMVSVVGSKETAAARRASMDLTRALAELRKNMR